MEFIFRKDDDKRFDRLWQQFIGKDTRTGMYSSLAMDYFRFYAANYSEDLSFVAFDGGRCVGVVPLFLEKRDGGTSFSYGGSYIRAPLCENKKVEEAVFAEIDSLAKKYKVSKCLLMLETSEWLGAGDKCNPFQRYGYLDASIATNVIDLLPSEKELLNAMRHGHSSLVKSALKHFKVEVFDRSNPDYGVHEEYRALHRKDAGRATRSKDTFDLQFKRIQADESVLFRASCDGKTVAFGHFSHGPNSAYYGSGASDPDFKDQPGAYHVLLWEAMRYYKSRDVRWLETGWQEFSLQLFDDPSEKDLTIASFKRGFGGMTIPLMRGVKYYDYGALEADMKRFMLRAKSGMIK